MKTINEQIEEIIISTVGVSLEGEYPYKIKLTNVDQAAKEIIALKQQAEKTPAQELSNNRQQSEDSANNLKTAKEILKGEMSENLWTFICSYPVSYKSEEKLVEWIIDAMQEYAAQFKAEKEKPIINLINNIECFAQILGKHCVDNKVSLTSNERHTIYDAFKEYIFQIEAEQEVDLNTPFFGNSGAKVPLTEAIITEEINKASLQHSENPENDIYYTAGYRDAIRDFRQKAEQEKVTDVAKAETDIGKIVDMPELNENELKHGIASILSVNKGYPIRELADRILAYVKYQIKQTEQEKPSESAEEILYAKSLKEMVGLALSYDECLSFVRGIYARQKHLPTDCYPKEFVEWCIESTAKCHPKGQYVEIEGNKEFKTLDELFIYWRDKIK